MRKKGMTRLEAAHEWVSEFNAISYDIIAALMKADDGWHEVTKPSEGDKVYVYETPEKLDTLEHCGNIVSYDRESELYCIELYDGNILSAEIDDFEVEQDDVLPMWGTLWSFDDRCDEWWLEEGDGIEIMSECGFRIYEHDEYGFFFGIDGAGYDFYESHWLPLYNKRGLKWHDDRTDDPNYRPPSYDPVREAYYILAKASCTKDYREINNAVGIAICYLKEAL